MSELHAITLPQPRAWAVANGRLRLVSMTIWTRHRGPIAIYAASRGVAVGFAPDEQRTLGPTPHPDELEYSSIIGIARLAAIVKAHQAREMVGNAPGPHVWLIEDARPIPPIAAPQRYGLWPVPDDLRDDIEAAVRNRPATTTHVETPREVQGRLFPVDSSKPRTAQPHVPLTDPEIPF